MKTLLGAAIGFVAGIIFGLKSCWHYDGYGTKFQDWPETLVLAGGVAILGAIIGIGLELASKKNA